MMENLSVREVFESLVGKAKSLKSEVKVLESTFLTSIFFLSVALYERIVLNSFMTEVVMKGLNSASKCSRYTFEVAISKTFTILIRYFAAYFYTMI